MAIIDKRYSDIIKNNPLLTKKQEIDLSRKIKKGDSEARKKLIESNYRLVLSIVKKYHRSDVSFDDLLQESSIGLLKAVDRFDPELGYKFSTYACWWIKQAALQYINENITNIKVPTHSRLLNAKIKNKIKEIEEDEGKKPTLERLSKEIGENVNKLKYTLKSNRYIASIDASRDDDGNTLASKIADESDFINPEQLLEKKELKQIIRESLRLLTAKEEKIIRLRFGITEAEFNNNNFLLTQKMEEYLNED
jgi:RNA polymerase sigma factor (sigma-70 family)